MKKKIQIPNKTPKINKNQNTNIHLLCINTVANDFVLIFVTNVDHRTHFCLVISFSVCYLYMCVIHKSIPSYLKSFDTFAIGGNKNHYEINTPIITIHTHTHIVNTVSPEQGSKENHNSQQMPQIEEKVFTDDELTSLIDPILKMDDTSNDGYIDYPEFIRAQQKAAANTQHQQQQQRQQH